MKPCSSAPPMLLHWRGWTAFVGSHALRVGDSRPRGHPRLTTPGYSWHLRHLTWLAAPLFVIPEPPSLWDAHGSMPLVVGAPPYYSSPRHARAASFTSLAAGYSCPRPTSLALPPSHRGTTRGDILSEAGTSWSATPQGVIGPKTTGARLNLYPAGACGCAILLSRRGEGRRLWLHP